MKYGDIIRTSLRILKHKFLVLLLDGKSIGSTHTQSTPHHTIARLFAVSTPALTCSGVLACTYRLCLQPTVNMMRAAVMSRHVVAAARPSAARSMSSTANVWVNKDTKVLCQGFTGKQVRENASCASRCGPPGGEQAALRALRLRVGVQTPPRLQLRDCRPFRLLTPVVLCRVRSTRSKPSSTARR